VTSMIGVKPVQPVTLREPVCYVTSKLKRAAELIVDRVNEMLCAQVSVIDERGIVIASTEPELLGFPLDLTARAAIGSYLHIPLFADGQSGKVIVGEPRNGELISARLAQVLVELVINQTTVVERLPNQTELKNHFIHDLLHGLIKDEETIMREGRVLGMDFSPPRAVILIDASAYILASANGATREAADGRVRRRAQLVIGIVVSFFHLPNDTICAYIGDGQVAVLKASNTQNLVSWVERRDSPDQSSASWANLSALRRAGEALLTRLRADTNAPITMGIGRYHPGLAGLAASYQDARVALSLGRLFHGQNGVHCLDRLGMAAFVGVSDEQTKIDLATYLLSPLDHEPELLKTLGVFFTADCCPSTAARRLAIHRNTLTYRLGKIAALTGLDPRRFDDAVQIRLALLMRSFTTPAGA
jgi:carbohydrate diacid regulator